MKERRKWMKSLPDTYPQHLCEQQELSHVNLQRVHGKTIRATKATAPYIHLVHHAEGDKTAA
ncbi:hypothetical protein ACJJWD_13565 [Comamonas testosteroni]|uniref:hypothetical protein n=1 Tax=Comamonas testosteroni TaxID=285 RepID=UPI00389A15E7